MEYIRQCLICGSYRLKELVSRTCRRPVEDLGGTSTGGDNYRSEMLYFLFCHLLPDVDDATFVVELCRDCGMVFSNPRLTPEEMSEKYRVLSSRPKLWEHANNNSPLRDDERANRIYRLLSEPGNGPLRSLSVLDYGGAQGLNLVPFTARYRCYLIDYVEHRIPPGVERLGRDLDDFHQEMRFDLILLCHVLEHVTHPVELLGRLAALLAAGGQLYVEVPLGAFREWRVFKEPLTHVNFFSEQSLGRCLARWPIPASKPIIGMRS